MVLGLLDRFRLLVEIDVVPDEEHIDRPDAAAVVLGAAEMLVQPRDQLVGVEELLGGLALELLLDDVVVFFIPQPYAGRHGEAELLFLGSRLGHMARRCLAQGVFGVLFVDAQLGGQLGRDPEHLFIEEGHTQLQGVRHAHAVGFQQDVARHPHVDVEILHLGHVVQTARAVVEPAGVALRRRGDGGILEQLLLLLEVVHEGVADVAILQLVAGADDIVPALDIGQPERDGAQRLAQEVRDDLLIESEHARVVVAGVAAEQLVGALAREHDLDIFGRETRHEVERHAGRIRQRLIHVILHGGHRVPEFLGGNQVGVVLDADVAAQFLRPADLIIFLAEVKADGEGLLIGKIGGHIAGIHARRQEATDLDVGDLVGVDGILKDLFDLIDRFVLGHVLVGTEARLKVAVGLQHAVLIPQVVARQQAIDVLEKGFGRHGILIGKIGIERMLVEALDKARVFQNALDLRGIDQLAVDLGVVHGLDTEEVARDEQRAVDGVVDGKGEHTAQTGEQILLPFLKAVHQHLAVGLGGEAVTTGDQLLAQLLVVVDLAVEGEDQGLVLVVDGLMSRLEVDDRQAAKAHGDGFVAVIAVGIGTAMGDDVRHALDDAVTVVKRACKAADTTHMMNPFQG